MVVLVATRLAAAAPAAEGEGPTGEGTVSPVTARAESMFAEGKRLLAEGRIAEACATLEEAHRVSPLPGILLNMAHCHERQGRLVVALAEYRAALARAQQAGRTDRVAFVEERLAALEPRLGRLIVRVSPRVRALDGLSVRVGGVPVAAERLGVSLPVDPGATVVDVRAAGHDPHVDQVLLAEGESGLVLVDELTPTPRVSAAPPPPGPIPTTPPTPARGETSTWLDTLGWSCLFVGGLALAAGGITGAVALAEEGAAENAGCTARTCPTKDGLTHSRTADGAAVAANVLIPSGLLLGATGATLLVVFD